MIYNGYKFNDDYPKLENAGLLFLNGNSKNLECKISEERLNPRPYRIAMSDEQALMEIRKHSGSQFAPDIAKIFVEKVLGEPWE